LLRGKHWKPVFMTCVYFNFYFRISLDWVSPKPTLSYCEGVDVSYTVGRVRISSTYLWGDKPARATKARGRRSPAPAGRPHCRPASLEERPSPSARAETRKMVIYSCAWRSQGKPWWRPVAILTCKSFVRRANRGERPIEPSGSWFTSKFPSG
jgi:hypothetical protein